MGKYKVVDYVAYSKILLDSMMEHGSVFGTLPGAAVDSRSSSAKRTKVLS